MPDPSCAVCGSFVDNMANCTQDMAHEAGWRACKACDGLGTIHERPTAWDVIAGTTFKTRHCVGCGGEGLHIDHPFIPKPRRVPLTRVQRLESYSTGYLMKLLKGTRGSGYDDYRSMEEPEGREPDFTAEEIKVVLATREHIPNKREGKRLRREAAKRGR